MEPKERACDNGHNGIDQQVCTFPRHGKHACNGGSRDGKLDCISDDGNGKSCCNTLF